MNIISTSFFLLDVVKMHWSSEWAEQHYDITSTTSPPAHPKPVSYPQPTHPTFSGYSDDIGALSASTLLKRYAERYSFSPVYPEPGAFRRTDPTQDAWSIGYNPEGIDGIKGSLASASNLSEQFSNGTISQDYTSTYSGSHLYPRPTYLHQPAFALPPTYPPPAPVYTYPPGLTTPSSPSLLTPLSSGLQTAHGAQALKRPEEFQEHKTFGFDQNKSTRLSSYTARENTEQPISNGIPSSGTDLQPFRPDRLPSQPDMKVDLVRKSSYLQSSEAASYGAEQYTYP
ncbi:fidgetin isoform X1 [Clarias gariepinus]|uniref:fidgetin isoform X1 n=2 Tax=Clarias gariepinus TaxID=13013 RepID=UPI00234DF1B9|nr:fidgetin isoform X1 [Clarias gariepinus]